MAVKKTTRKVLSQAQRITREKAIIHDLRAGSLSYRKIAAKHHVSLPTVNAKARKAGIRRRPTGRRAIAAQAPARLVARRAVRTATRKARTRTTRRAYPGSGAATRFNENFRKLVMSYYPSMPLAKFERLTRMIRQAVTL
jgi:DNA-binding CsgD family transcriptional regulator